MLKKAFESGVTAAWVTSDAAYGCDGGLRRWLEGRGHPYALGVRSNQYAHVGPYNVGVAELVRDLPEGSWQGIEVGERSKGPRKRRWTWLPTDDARREDWRRWVLARWARRPGRGVVLPSGRPGGHDVGANGPGRLRRAGDPGRVRVGQARDRAGGLRGAGPDGLAPARHAGAAGPRDPRRGP